ncbi:DUF2779 domain-containing protein [Derxia gummosa]|uniref:DUF2779 domain-containing protein n=1 Tax=Derxia gummosa DSM 723 TaxID=1121388 RepID=A0A8B6X1D4_9BURK|nr:DUF2779 domain-containing protein [Derxia gummosa]
MSAAAALTESDFARFRQCPRRHWLHRQRGDAETPPPVDALVTDVLSRAWPGAVRIPLDAPFDDRLAATAQALGAAAPRPILDGCFRTDEGIEVRVDLLVPLEKGTTGRWRVVGIRHASSFGEHEIDLVALAARAVRGAGVHVAGVDVARIDTDFIYPGFGWYGGLFAPIEVSGSVEERPLGQWLADLRTLPDGPEPATPPGAHCQRPLPCPYATHCAPPPEGEAAEADRLRLDLLGRDLAAELRAEGRGSLADVPPTRLPNDRLRRMQQAIVDHRVIVEPGAARELARYPGRRRWLRFETIGFAVPIWSGTRPYQVLPYQWACDVERMDGSGVEHLGFLADRSGDPRRAFAESLLTALGQTGPVFAYNAGFERNRIVELAALFDDLAPALNAVAGRIVDLFHLLRAHAYHPAMDGSWSARSVFGAFAPDVEADRFDAADGATPLEAFALSLRDKLDPAEVQRLRAALDDYGRRQTLALRRLTEALGGESSGH